MTKALILGSSIAAFAIASAALAAQPAPPAPPGVAPGTAPAPMAHAPAEPRMRIMFGGDRVMTRDEVTQHVDRMFEKLDANWDGFITKQEIDAIHQKMMAAMDRVGDVEKRLAARGVFMGDRGAMFDRLDTNHDGNISRQEFTAGRPEQHERVMIMRGGPDGAHGGAATPGHSGMGMGMHHMGGMGMAMHRMGGMGMGIGGHMMEMADSNHDGRVSLAEARSAALAHFDKVDVNHDGKITPDERREMRQTVRFERRAG